MNDPARFSDLVPLFQRVIGAVFALGGLACFAFILVGSLKYLSAGGDDKAVQSAKNTLTFAIIGFVIMVGGWAFFSTILGDQVLNFGDIKFDLPVGTP